MQFPAALACLCVRVFMSRMNLYIECCKGGKLVDLTRGKLNIFHSLFEFYSNIFKKIWTKDF